MTGGDLALAAQALVGAPYRLHGRNPATGLDCIGVLACALEAAGRQPALPSSYRLRNRTVPPFDAMASTNGLSAASGSVLPGDVLIVRPGPCQQHLLIASAPHQFVHAHIALKRIVCGPLRPDWPLLGHWRLTPSPQEP